MRLQTQLFAVMALLFTLVLGSVAGLTYNTQSKELRSLVFDRYFMVTNTLTIWLSEYIMQGNWAQMERKTMGSLSKIPDVVYAFVGDRNGEIMASFDETMLENLEVSLISMDLPSEQILEHRKLHNVVSAVPVAYTIWENVLLEDSLLGNEIRGKKGDKVFDLHQKLYYGRDYVGYIRIGFSQKLLEEKLSVLRNSVLLAAVLLLFLTLCVSLFVTRRFTRTLRRFTREVSKIGADHNGTHLQERSVLQQLKQMHLKELNSNTYEFQQLAEAFEKMNQYLITDISEHQETERKLTRSNTELKIAHNQLVQSAKLASLGELATSIAHELKQPLTVIMMAASEGSECLAYKEYDGVRDALHTIARSASRGGHIVDRMRVFGRTTGKDKRIPTDMNECIHNTMTLMKKTLSEQKIVINLELNEDLPEVLADSIQMEQVLTNLIGNARDAMEFVEAKKLTICSYQNKNHVILDVKDTAGGIPAQILPQIFNSFFTTKESGKGTGLGLSISKGIVRDHGGEISVQSKQGRGSTFKIELPIYRA